MKDTVYTEDGANDTRVLELADNVLERCHCFVESVLLNGANRENLSAMTFRLPMNKYWSWPNRLWQRSIAVSVSSYAVAAAVKSTIARKYICIDLDCSLFLLS